jgi:hypothetical protein
MENPIHPYEIGPQYRQDSRFAARMRFHQSWTRRPDSPWPVEAWDRLHHSSTNQIWRDHLLAAALLLSPGSPYSAGHFLVITHPGDDDPGEQTCSGSLAAYQGLLKPGDPTFHHLTLDQVARDWSAALEREQDRQWMDKFTLRYLDLDQSEEEYTQFKQQSDTRGR